MKFRINHGPSADCVVIEAENIEGIREKAKEEADKRGWKEEDLWSEEIA